MTELQLLFLVLAVIYLWECACWIPRGSIAFLTWTERRWRLTAPSVMIGNQRGGFAFGAPFPPLGSVLIANPLPVSLSPDAVLAYVSTTVDPGGRPGQTGKLATFEQVQNIEVRGRKMFLDKMLFVKAASAGQAAWLAENLRDLGKAARATREKKIRKLFDEILDVKKIRIRWDEFQKQTDALRFLANAVFCYLFILAPAVIWRFGHHSTWLPLLLGLFTLTFLTALRFRKIHKTFYPKAEDERFTHFLTTMLSPATTVRVRDVLSRPLFECFHPLAVAKVFCGDAVFTGLARRTLLDVRYPALPVAPGNDPAASEAERCSRSIWQNALEDFLTRNGLDIQKLAQAPPADEGCAAYCPRCLAQFTGESATCADCGGLELVKFHK
jgi:hypothetical protein